MGTTCIQANLKMSGSLTAVREMSGIDQKSVKLPGCMSENIVRDKYVTDFKGSKSAVRRSTFKVDYGDFSCTLRLLKVFLFQQSYLDIIY